MYRLNPDCVDGTWLQIRNNLWLEIKPSADSNDVPFEVWRYLIDPNWIKIDTVIAEQEMADNENNSN